MAIQKKIKLKAERRARRVRFALKQSLSLPRVSVFRSSSHIYAQIIDDQTQKTLASCSSLELKELSGDKTAVARAIGRELSTRAKSKGIDSAVFDRGSFLYHGRVKALAEGLREGGLKI